jgi:hypothetical protein
MCRSSHTVLRERIIRAWLKLILFLQHRTYVVLLLWKFQAQKKKYQFANLLFRRACTSYTIWLWKKSFPPEFESAKVGTKVMPPFFNMFSMWPRVEFLPQPADSDTVQPHHLHRCSSQSRVFNTVEVQMAADVGIRIRQIIATEFLGTESSSPIGIHRRLRSVYGEDAIDISSVRR